MNNKWIKTKNILPPDNRVVKTKIDDKDGIRNICNLKRYKNLWWSEDGYMYVYYSPTHWQYIDFED